MTAISRQIMRRKSLHASENKFICQLQTRAETMEVLAQRGWRLCILYVLRIFTQSERDCVVQHNFHR
jgi:hypothetical protein